MTDNEIIKALECCLNGRCNRARCPRFDSDAINHKFCRMYLLRDVFNLIIRQKAEIERLENSLAISKKETRRYAAQCQTIRSDVAKEFAERLKSKHRRILGYNKAGFLVPTNIVYVETIDNLEKEFTEKKENDR